MNRRCEVCNRPLPAREGRGRPLTYCASPDGGRSACQRVRQNLTRLRTDLDELSALLTGEERRALRSDLMTLLNSSLRAEVRPRD